MYLSIKTRKEEELIVEILENSKISTSFKDDYNYTIYRYENEPKKAYMSLSYYYKRLYYAYVNINLIYADNKRAIKNKGYYKDDFYEILVHDHGDKYECLIYYDTKPIISFSHTLKNRAIVSVFKEIRKREKELYRCIRLLEKKEKVILNFLGGM